MFVCGRACFNFDDITEETVVLVTLTTAMIPHTVKWSSARMLWLSRWPSCVMMLLVSFMISIDKFSLGKSILVCVCV